MAYDIAGGEWRVKGYFPFKTHHPERVINAPMYADRITEQWLIEKYFIPVLTPQIFKYNIACQEGKGMFLAMDEIKGILSELYKVFGKEFCIFQFDCKKYFDTISHRKAFETFKRYRICDMGLYYYDVIIESFHETTEAEECYAARNDPEGIYGFPKGNLPSQWTGIMYLNDLDWKIFASRYSLFNIRYMDDGQVYCKDHSDTLKMLRATRDYFKDENLGIMLHPKKTNIFPVTRGFTFCGWHYRLTDDGKIIVTIKNEKKREEEEKLKRTAQSVRNGDMDIDKAFEIREGIFAYLAHGTDSDDLIDYMKYQYQFYDGEYKGRRVVIPRR